MKKLEKKYLELVELLHKYNYYYYEKNESLVSDVEYDKLLKELDLTEAKELYQLIMSLSKSPTLTKEQVIDINKAITFLNELILEIIELMQKDIRTYNLSGWTVYHTSLASSHEFNFYKENLYISNFIFIND